MDALTSKLETMATDALVDVVIALRDTYTAEADAVQERALAILEGRLPSDQFVRFCDDLYATMS